MMAHEEIMELHELEIEDDADVKEIFTGYPREEASDEAVAGISAMVETFELEAPAEFVAGPAGYEI